MSLRSFLAIGTLVRRAAVAGVVCLLLPALGQGAAAQDFETKARWALLMDAETETVLYQKAADERMPPASLGKLMTMAVLFRALAEGQLTLEDEFVISEDAWRRGGAVSGGSTMFAELGSSVAVADLMRGVIVQSGNDAAIAIAENMAGTESTFAGLMNKEAERIGLRDSNFRNATGLPDDEQWVTARDLALLANHIIQNYPDHYEVYSEPAFTWNGIRQQNRNPLLGMNIGADGMKTGYTEASGYGLVGSAVRDGQRLIVIINGAETANQRANDARKLLDWGFRAFDHYALEDTTQPIAQAKVYGGTQGRVGLHGENGLDVLLPIGDIRGIRVEVVYDGPIEAPVTKGDQVARLRIWQDGKLMRDTPLFATEDVGVGNMRQRAFDAIGELLLGWL